MIDVSDIRVLELQEELIILKNDFEIKSSFKINSYHDFWQQESIPDRYPNL